MCFIFFIASLYFSLISSAFFQKFSKQARSYHTFITSELSSTYVLRGEVFEKISQEDIQA